jgi:hypothetical protein
MTTVAGVIITKALQRVRDEQGSAHSRDFVRKILSHAQRITNAIFGEVKVTTTFTTEPNRLAYPIQPNLPDSLRIARVTHNKDELLPETLQGLRGFDSSWPRTRGDKYLSYAPVGRDLFLLYPALKVTGSVEVTSIKDTGLIVGESSNMDLPDSDVKVALDITEIILLLRQRDLDEAENLIKTVTERLSKRQA